MSDNDHCPLPGGGITTPDQPLISFTARSEHLETRGVDNLTAGGDGKIVILKNFVVICPPGHRLDTLSLNVIGPDQGEAPTKLTMKNVSETKWECPSSVHMSWDTATLKLAACSDCDEDLGFVVLKKDDMLSLIPEDQDVQLELDLKESSPPLKISFVIGVNKLIPEAQSPSLMQTNIILQSILNSEQNFGCFTSMIKQLPKDPALLNYLGDVFSDQFEETHNEDDIQKAIFAYESAVALSTSENSNYRFYLCDTGLAFTRRYQLSGNLDDLDQAISMFEASIACNPGDPEDLIESFNNLAMTLQYRFKRTGNLTDLHHSISLLQKTVKETSDKNPILPLVFNTLGTSFQMLFERSGKLEDISAAISAKQKAIDLTPDDSDRKPAFFSDLGHAFQKLFESKGHIEDIEKAILYSQTAIALITEDHPDIFLFLNNLGTAYQCRFERTGSFKDLESSMANLQKAVNCASLTDENFPVCLSNLGIALAKHAEITGNLQNIQNAIFNLEKAIKLFSQNHIMLPTVFCNLGNCFLQQFERTGQISDIEKAILNMQKAIDSTPAEHFSLPSSYSGLAICLERCFESTGNLIQLEDAIFNLQKAVELTPAKHVDLPVYLTNLACSFRTRYQRTNNFVDIESAIFNHQQAIELLPDGHPNIPGFLNNLGTCFQLCFEKSDNPVDLSRAISVKEKAISLTEDSHADMPLFLISLANALQLLFRKTGNSSDIDNALSKVQKAISLTPDGDARMPSRLNALGSILQDHYKETKNFIDIENAVHNLQRAVDLTPPQHRSLSIFLNNLAVVLDSYFPHPRSAQDTSQIISVFHRSACEASGLPYHRFVAAAKWAELSRPFQLPETLQAYSIAIKLISQIAGLEQTIQKRHENLSGIEQLTVSASSAAIAQGNLELALSWLEQGRCLVWNQIHQLRTPVDILNALDPSLATQFVTIASALEALGSRHEGNSIFSPENMNKMIMLQEEVRTQTLLAKQWNDLLSEIWGHPGFEDFLQGPKIDSLLSAIPAGSAIIILNIDEERCDALALISTCNAPIHIPLGLFNYKQAVNLNIQLHKCLRSHGVRSRNADPDRAGQKIMPSTKTEEVMRMVLRVLWQCVAKPVLDALVDKLPLADRPRIWWCPTGPLSFLPIHAAGMYGTPNDVCVSDFVISSYTPTVSALVDKIKEAPKKKSESSLLLICQPNTPGKAPIPATRKETHAIHDMMQQAGIRSLLLEDDAATTTRVPEELKAHGWVHFACHGSQDPAEPLNGGVHLHDGCLTLLEIMRQHIPNTVHAFLSACETSTGHGELSDEVVHLAAGMLAAGYQGVVATMWSIKDDYGPKIAGAFYEHLLEGAAGEGGKKHLDGVRAARALDHAIRSIREEIGDSEEALLTWVPYVHFGI